MQPKPPYCLPTEETEDGSSEENPRTMFINLIEEANIIDVWSENFHEEMEKISVLTKKYNIIAIDTQFPSIEQYDDKLVYLSGSEHEKYLRVAKNVDSTSLIQLGLCLADEEGSVAGQRFCWQFNFKFEGDIESISSSSGYLLKKAGINFQKLRCEGISYKTFTHEFIKSGLLLNKKNKWIVFHGGYDFSYMLKLIRNECSPKSSEEFYKSIKIYFPQKIDLKVIIQNQKKLKKLGLSKLADSLSCSRIGPEHQAGSDALLTLQCYFKIKQQYPHLFDDNTNTDNQIFGIGTTQLKPSNTLIYSQYPQSYVYVDQSTWHLIQQQNFMYYQHFNQQSPENHAYFQSQQYSESQQNFNFADQGQKYNYDQNYENHEDKSYKNDYRELYRKESDRHKPYQSHIEKGCYRSDYTERKQRRWQREKR